MAQGVGWVIQMSDLELQITMDTIGTVLRDGGKNPDQIEEMLIDESYRVAQELRDQEEG